MRSNLLSAFISNARFILSRTNLEEAKTLCYVPHREPSALMEKVRTVPCDTLRMFDPPNPLGSDITVSQAYVRLHFVVVVFS